MELGQCPDHVVRFLDDPTKLGSWAWRSAGLAKEGQTLDKGNDTDADIEIVWSEEMIISFIRESSLACVAIPVGALIPNDSWWTEFQLAFEQIDCSVDRSETIRNLGRKLRDDDLFDLLSLANQAAIERFSSSSASVAKPHEQTAIIYQELGLRLATGNKLTRDCRIEYATIPWGKARTYLAALLHAGNRGASWQDFEPDLSPNPDEIERTDRNRVDSAIHKLRKCVVKVDVQITFNRETKRYVLVDAAAAGAAPTDF